MTDIYFRTDGNSEIATGHLVRCLAIARACVKMGADVKFIVSDEESLTLLEERFATHREFAAFCLKRSYLELNSEIPALLSCLASDMPAENDRPAGDGSHASHSRPWLFIDSYSATTSYFMALRRYFKTAYLDDLRCFDCAVDLVVNYDTSEDCAAYANAGRKLLGIQYTPLREQFLSPACQVRRKAEHVLLSTGGTDPYRVAEGLLQIVYDNLTDGLCAPPQNTDHRLQDHRTVQDMSLPNVSSQQLSTQDRSVLQSMHYHVLTSRANTRYEALTALAQTHPFLHIHTNVSSVAALMASCDLAVSAGGTTLCELCAVGVPTVSYLMAENQRVAVEAYAKESLIPCAGDIRPLAAAGHTGQPADASAASACPSTLRHIIAFLIRMANDHPARAAVSAAMRNYLDGTGARQIAEALMAGHPCS